MSNPWTPFGHDLKPDDMSFQDPKRAGETETHATACTHGRDHLHGPMKGAKEALEREECDPGEGKIKGDAHPQTAMCLFAVGASLAPEKKNQTGPWNPPEPLKAAPNNPKLPQSLSGGPHSFQLGRNTTQKQTEACCVASPFFGQVSQVWRMRVFGTLGSKQLFVAAPY